MAKKKQKPQQFLSPGQYLKQKARTLEIGKCYMTDSIAGLRHVIVSRIHTGGKISMAEYLIDTNGLGLKQSYYQLRMEDYEFEDLINNIEAKECTYNEAHNWIYGAIAFAEEAGIAPNNSFNLTQYMLEEDTDEIPLIVYDFGNHENEHRDYEKNEYYDIEELAERLKGFKDSPIFKSYGPDTVYTYKHPEYPATITLHHLWLAQELAKTENALYLNDELIDRILSLPHEELREDLEQLIIYHIGLTCDGIPDNYGDGDYNGTLATATMLLAEVGNDTSSLDVVLEVMRQSPDFFEYHFCDSTYQVVIPTLYKLAQHQLDRLKAFVREEGLYTNSKSYVFSAVAQFAIHQPERRNEILEWFRQALRFATEHIAETQVVDSDLAGFMICDAIDLQAMELKEEIKALCDTNLVSLGICGPYEEVVKDLNDPILAGRPTDCTLEIHDRFDYMRRTFCKNN